MVSMLEVRRVDGVMPDPSRLIARPFIPGTLNFGGGLSKLDHIVQRVLEIPPEEKSAILEEQLSFHGDRYHRLEDHFRASFATAREFSELLNDVTDEKVQMLVGAFVTHAYAYEAAALTNPSMVPYGATADGEEQAFVMSARAIGEGHISSIAFMTGSVDVEGNVRLDPRFRHVSEGKRSAPVYSQASFANKLTELGFMSRAARAILALLPEHFDTKDLEQALSKVLEADLDRVELEDAVRRVHWLAVSNYELSFDRGLPVSEHLICPASPAESRGMEDARFVRFTDDDGEVIFYATYTAYDGTRILPQLIETPNFHSFRIATLTAPAIHHKGMALFPRRIQGEFVALSRHDQENTFILRSDDIRNWNNAELVLGPQYEWEAVQIGNCGSPIETDDGWLIITHGVGPMRRYSLGAVLVDLDEPTKVLGRLRQPFVEAQEEESFGYVPNVVYSCGSMVHGDHLITPYGFADHGIRFAVSSVSALLAEIH